MIIEWYSEVNLISRRKQMYLESKTNTLKLVSLDFERPHRMFN